MNYAFAYIDSADLQIVPMDTQTPVHLFKNVANLKAVKHDLKVFVSIGGW